MSGHWTREPPEREGSYWVYAREGLQVAFVVFAACGMVARLPGSPKRWQDFADWLWWSEPLELPDAPGEDE